MLQKTCISIIVMLMLTSTLSANDSTWVEHEMTFTTSDNLTLHYWLNRPTSTNSTDLIILLPMMGQTHKSYGQFIEALGRQLDLGTETSSYPFIVSFDLRGHGKSTTVDSVQLNYRNMTPEDFAKLPQDIAEATISLLQNKEIGLSIDSIIVVGASIGANTTAILSRKLDRIKSMVLLSAGENYRGLRPAEAIRKYNGKILMYAGKQDNYSAVSTRELGRLNKNCKVVILDTADHGTRIINNDPDAMKQMIRWILSESTR